LVLTGLAARTLMREVKVEIEQGEIGVEGRSDFGVSRPKALPGLRGWERDQDCVVGKSPGRRSRELFRGFGFGEGGEGRFRAVAFAWGLVVRVVMQG